MIDTIIILEIIMRGIKLHFTNITILANFISYICIIFFKIIPSE